MPGKVIAQLMGHAKVDTTLNVYAQVLDGSVREAAALLAAARPAERADLGSAQARNKIGFRG